MHIHPLGVETTYTAAIVEDLGLRVWGLGFEGSKDANNRVLGPKYH